VTEPELASITVADPPAAWAAAGFRVDDGEARVGGVRVVLAGPDAGRGVVGWGLRGLAADAPDDLDGLPVERVDERPRPPDDHPCGAVGVDHVVLLTEDLTRTVEAVERLGLRLRRERDHRGADGRPVQQAFFRAGEVIVEVVAPADAVDEPRPGVRTFGLAVVVLDFDVARRAMAGALSDVRDAVQPGRQVATVRGRELGLSTPLLLISPG